jgi:exopolysaccharide production protein ExoY
MLLKHTHPAKMAERRRHGPFTRIRPSAVSLGPAEYVGGSDRSVEREPAIGGRAKRTMDLVLAGAALVLLAPFMLLIAALIRMTMGGPVIFTQERIGLNGRPFTFLKFRTMCTDADEVLRNYLASNPAAAAEWRETQKLMRDPRVTRVGRFLRKSSLDELPQLLNVLRGDMSLVGPRPILRSEVWRYGRYARRCFRARPGLTGLWQVSGRNRISYRSRVALDRYYASHWSIWLDLLVMLKTIPALLNADTA